MSFRTLNYRELDEAYAFIRDAEGDGAVPSDHPDFYGATRFGVHRAPLPTLVDRGHLRFDEVEDALIAMIDDADREPEFDPFEDDLPSDDGMSSDDDLYYRDMLCMIEEYRVVTQATARFIRAVPEDEPVGSEVVMTGPGTALAAAVPDMPTVIGSRRAAIVTLTGDKHDAHPRRKVICWKRAHSHVRHQFERHAD